MKLPAGVGWSRVEAEPEVKGMASGVEDIPTESVCRRRERIEGAERGEHQRRGGPGAGAPGKLQLGQ